VLEEQDEHEEGLHDERDYIAAGAGKSTAPPRGGAGLRGSR
jgi:hypothetical protein